MNFRHLLEQHQLARQLFKTINRWLAEAGVMMTQGTLVDATIIEAPSSTKNKEQQRDPEMHQTKKGNQWHFGMKAHIGVDAKSGLTHSLVTTAANEHDLNQLGNLLHGEEQFVSADAGYQGAPQREELAEVDVDWLIAERPGKVKTLKQNPRKNKTAINIEYMKASIRARGEHPFRIIKRQFGFVKARYRNVFTEDDQGTYSRLVNRAEMSPEAAGIAACLMTYSHHACRTECYAMTVHYYRLRDYALQHPECSAIMRIID